MENRRTELMASLMSLREEMKAHQNTTNQSASSIVSLNQSFDRLLLGYQNGSYNDETVQKGITEIRAHLSEETKASNILRPTMKSARNEVLNRNYKALAERMLEEKKGSWDNRHLDIVQGAITHLAENGSSEAQEVARSLQNRMSDSVWFGNLELAETVSQVQEETRLLQQSLLESLRIANTAEETESLSLPETEHILANEETVRKAVEQASVQSMRSRMNSDYESLKVSKSYVESLAQKVSSDKNSAAQNTEIDRANESLRKASQKLLEQDNERIRHLVKSAISAVVSELTPETAQQLSHVTNDLSVQNVRNTLNSLHSSNPRIRETLQELDRIQWRSDVLNELANGTVETSESAQKSDEAQLLDARMMFEQKRMQFEQNPDYQTNETDLLKALDFEIPTPTFQSSSNYRTIQNNIQRVRQIAQSAAAGDVGLYAPRAGSEYSRNTKTALELADDAAPAVSAIPTLQNESAKRSNRLLKDIKQLAYMPSVRADMGFVAPRSQMDAASAQPLFKRVRFSQDNKQVNQLLPALYNISGIKLKKDNSSPLRKAYKDLNLQAANLELVKIIENNFDPTAKGRNSDKVSGAANDPSQRVDAADNPHARVAGIISDWVDSRKDLRRLSADTSSLINTGRMSANAIESSLKSEAMQLPASVQAKLSPFLGFDLSTVKIFTGPIAAMASEAMGAHAFTLGKNVFLGENKLNFDTPEGLGLLAHEILHTSHFGSGESVEAKEQAAEAMESRVKQAFGSGGTMSLALERDTDKKSTGKTDERSSNFGTLKPDSVGARPTYDAEYVFDTVCEKVVELMYASFQREKEREGTDR